MSVLRRCPPYSPFVDVEPSCDPWLFNKKTFVQEMHDVGLMRRWTHNFMSIDPPLKVWNLSSFVKQKNRGRIVLTKFTDLSMSASTLFGLFTVLLRRRTTLLCFRSHPQIKSAPRNGPQFFYSFQKAAARGFHWDSIDQGLASTF